MERDPKEEQFLRSREGTHLVQQEVETLFQLLRATSAASGYEFHVEEQGPKVRACYLVADAHSLSFHWFQHYDDAVSDMASLTRKIYDGAKRRSIDTPSPQRPKERDAYERSYVPALGHDGATSWSTGSKRRASTEEIFKQAMADLAKASR